MDGDGVCCPPQHGDATQAQSLQPTAREKQIFVCTLKYNVAHTKLPLYDGANHVTKGCFNGGTMASG